MDSMENKTNNTEKQCFLWLDVNNDTTLDDLNDQFTIRHLGGIIFTGILMVLGIFGNITVLWIYIRRSKMTNYIIYAICLAVMDVANCCIGMPFLIYYMSHYLIFPSTGLCKLGRFAMVFTTNCSAYLLVVIAIDRYRKICKTLDWQFSPRHAKIACIIAISVGMVTSWPALVLYGVYTVNTHIPNVHGIRCWTADAYRNTVYPSLYYIGLYIFNFTVVPILFVAYIRILLFIQRRKSSGITINTRKTTITLLAVTVAFVLSAIPHYSMVVTTRILKDFNCKMTFSEGVAYYTFVFSILLNNSVNPFIYGFYDQKFRREIKRMYYDLCGIRRSEDQKSSDAESESQATRGNGNTYAMQEKSSKTYLDDY